MVGEPFLLENYKTLMSYLIWRCNLSLSMPTSMGISENTLRDFTTLLGKESKASVAESVCYWGRGKCGNKRPKDYIYEGKNAVTRILDSSCYKVFKIVLDILIVLQSLSGQVVQFDDFLLSPPSPLHIGLPLTHSASRNVTIFNCIPDYILMSSAFEISPTPSKSHQRAVTDKIQCLLGTKLFTICKMNCHFFYKDRFSRLLFILMSKF